MPYNNNNNNNIQNLYSTLYNLLNQYLTCIIISRVNAIHNFMSNKEFNSEKQKLMTEVVYGASFVEIR